MARILSRTLIRYSTLYNSCSRSKSALIIPQSSLRNLSSKASLTEIDLDSSSSSDGARETEFLAIKKLEDMIRRIIVHKSTPDWLPFVPGSSFWVPPQRDSSKIVDLVDKLSNQLSEEESLSLTTLRGWPCSSVLVQDGGSNHPVTLEFSVKNKDEVEVNVMASSEDITETKDEKE